MNQVASALARHRDDPPPRLELSIPVDRFLDVDYLGHLQDDLRDQIPDGFETLKATKRTHEMIPPAAGVYMFVWCPSFHLHCDDMGLSAKSRSARYNSQFILYVGKAGGDGSKATLRSRYQSEYRRFVGGDVNALWNGAKGQARSDLLERWLCLVPLEYWFAVVPDGSMVSSIEKRLIDLLNPPLNQIKGPRLKAAGIKSAF